MARPLGRRPRLNGLRGVAILMIVGFHATRERYLPGGFVGVDLFFVLSGFLITALLLEEWDSAGRISLRRFYVRRALRLFPALGLFLLACLAIYARVDGSLQTLMGRFLLATTFYVANIVQAGGTELYWAHTWSLSAEEQFYVVWPALLILLLRSRAPRGVVVGVTGGLFAAASALRVVLWHGPFAGDVGAALYSPFTHADGLLLGCLLGQLFIWDLLPRAEWWRRGVAVAAAVSAVLLAVVLATVHPAADWLYDGGYSLIVLAGGAILLTALDERVAAPVRALGWRPLTYTGQISYALYLWNPLFLFNYPGSAFNPVVGVVLAYAVSAASFRFVETPALRLKSRFAGVRHQAAVVVEPASLPGHASTASSPTSTRSRTNTSQDESGSNASARSQ
jgi:peptidoglycan/LPS O-acetylase OafA/YrhL